MHPLIRILALGALALSTQVAHAIIQPQAGEFAFSGEYLYFHPIYNQSYYAFEYAGSPFTNTAEGRRIDNPMNYHSGYRLEALYAFCGGCRDLDLRWTYLDSNNTSTISGPALGRTINTGDAEPFAGTASSNINIGYYAVDALIGQMLYDTCTFDMKLQAGLHYANINFEEDIRYAGVDSVTTFIARNAASAKFWGTGPELAVNLDYKLSSYFNWDCLPLALVGNARAALLVGQSNTSFQALNDAFARGYDFNNENKWLVVPMWDMRFGLSSQMNFRCITANLEVGFEVLRYEQVIQTQNPIVIDTVMTDDYSNLGFYGPYVALGFCF